MRTRNAILLASTLTVVCTSVEAQQLTRSQAGRVAVAQCYARCTEMVYAQVPARARFVLDGLDGEWNLAEFLLAACVVVQSDVQALDMCRAGCLDIEAAYGWRSSHIRSRFSAAYNAAVRDARAAGLWNQWNDFPDVDSERFARGCARYFKTTSSRSKRFDQIREDEVGSLSQEILRERRQQIRESEIILDPPPIDDPDFWD